MEDKLMLKRGYKNVKEDKYGGVIYERNKSQDFIHIVTICHKKSGKYIIQSYWR